MPDLDTVRSWEGRTLVDRDGGRIGPIEAIYLDDQTGQPEWALVNTGLFGTRSSFVPLAQATSGGQHHQRLCHQRRLVMGLDLDRVLGRDQHAAAFLGLCSQQLDAVADALA